MADRRRENKKKHKKKKNRDNLESSGSESDTVYPSNLLQKENADREEAQVRVSETFIWLDDLQTPTDSPFCIDRRADRANWEYKSLYRGDIARSASLSSSSRCQTLYNAGEHCDCVCTRELQCVLCSCVSFNCFYNPSFCLQKPFEIHIKFSAFQLQKHFLSSL